jgi:hypothetical protein
MTVIVDLAALAAGNDPAVFLFPFVRRSMIGTCVRAHKKSRPIAAVVHKRDICGDSECPEHGRAFSPNVLNR